MVGDTVLGSNLRAQLFAIQRTSKAMDAAQLRLATGRRVNSALDNPQNFFASQALNNRASDLQRLLDGIGQDIQIIKAADAGVEALSHLIEQAESVTQQARDLLPTLQTEARAAGDIDLRNIDDLTSLDGINNGDRIRLTFRDREDETFNPVPVFVAINTNMSTEELVVEINDLNSSAFSEETLKASLSENGELEIATVNGDIMMIEFVAGAVGLGTPATNRALAGALGFGQQVAFSTDIFNQNSVGFVVYPDATLTSFEFSDVTTGETALRSTRMADIRTPGNLNPFFNLLSAGDEYQIGINSGTRSAIALDGTITVQGFIDAINNDANLSQYIKADFITDTGQITITAISGDVDSIELGVNSTNIITAFLGFDVRLPVAVSPAFTPDITSIQLPGAAGEMKALESEYSSILGQIDILVTNNDTGYRGTNLLNGDVMETFFNEGRSSSLVTDGVEFTASGLGLEAPSFVSATSIDSTFADIRGALEAVRAFGTSLANNLNIIKTREVHIDAVVNTLHEGADKLSLADQNEEGAKLLSLQVTQQMAITALALASQSQSSVLRLF